MKLVSLIIPFKTDRGWLDEAEKSVQNQFYNNIELILSQSDGNVAYNLNQGIKKAKGDYIKYLCDDDYLSPNSIYSSVLAIKDYDFIHGIAMDVYNGGYMKPYVPAITHPTLKDMVKQNVIHGGTIMYRADVFERFGLFDESLDCAEEYEMNMRLLYNGCKLTYTDELLYYYRRHNHQKSLGVMVDQKERNKKIQAIKNRYR